MSPRSNEFDTPLNDGLHRRSRAAHVLTYKGTMSGAEGGGFILATYREIAEHFKLSGPDAGRTKAKQRHWEIEPGNHPLEIKRVRIPRSEWDHTGLKTRRRPMGDALERNHGGAPEGSFKETEIPYILSVLDDALATLKKGLEREGLRADQAEARAQAAEARATHAEIRVESATAEMDKLRTELTETQKAAAEESRRVATALAEAGMLRAAETERASWTLLRRVRWVLTGR